MLKLTFKTNISSSFINIMIRNYSLKCKTLEYERITVTLQVNYDDITTTKKLCRVPY
jgi:hypothetical protein